MRSGIISKRYVLTYINKYFYCSLKLTILSLILGFGVYTGVQALDITEDTTWGNDKVLTESVNICPGATLTIKPGVKITAESKKDITIRTFGGGGTLNAQGTETEPIIFTSNASSPLPGDWDGISLKSGSDSSILRYCIVEYGGSMLGGNIDIEHSSPTLEYVTSRYGQDDGIEFNSASPKIDHCEIYENYSGGMNLAGTSNPVITNTKVINNGRDGVYIQYSALPDLGNIGDENPNNNGLNTFADNAQYDVYNANPNQVKAENNWWGTKPPHVYGNVDWDPVAGYTGIQPMSIGMIKAIYK
jgi:parallel beta-helix repeat protein